MSPVASQQHASARTCVSHAEAAPAFSSEELGQLQTEDKHAATAIIGIMVAIFAIALVMYAVICFLVAEGH